MQCTSLEAQLERQKLDNAEGEQRLAELRAQLVASERQTCSLQLEARQKRDAWEKQRREARISSLLGTMSKDSSATAGSLGPGSNTGAANYFGDDAFSLGAGPSLESASAARRVHFSAEPPHANNSLLEVGTIEIRLRSESITNKLFGFASEPPSDTAKVRPLFNDYCNVKNMRLSRFELAFVH